MAVLHQKIRAVFFARDGKWLVFRNALHYLHIAYVQLVAARRAPVGAAFSGNDHAGFVRQVLERVEYFRRYLVLGHDTLDHAGAVAKDRKNQLAALALVVQPALNGYSLAVMPANFRDGGDWRLSHCFHTEKLPHLATSSRRS